MEFFSLFSCMATYRSAKSLKICPSVILHIQSLLPPSQCRWRQWVWRMAAIVTWKETESSALSLGLMLPWVGCGQISLPFRIRLCLVLRCRKCFSATEHYYNKLQFLVCMRVLSFLQHHQIARREWISRTLLLNRFSLTSPLSPSFSPLLQTQECGQAHRRLVPSTPFSFLSVPHYSCFSYCCPFSLCKR